MAKKKTKYDKKINVKGASFDDLVSKSVAGNPKPKNNKLAKDKK